MFRSIPGHTWVEKQKHIVSYCQDLSMCCHGVAVKEKNSILVVSFFFPERQWRSVITSYHILSSHLLIFISSHIFSSSNLLTFASSHLQSSSHLLTSSNLLTSSHLHIFSSSHLLTSFHLLHIIFSSSSHLLHIFLTSYHLHILTSSHLHIFTSSSHLLHIFSFSFSYIFNLQHILYVLLTFSIVLLCSLYNILQQYKSNMLFCALGPPWATCRS